MAADDLGTSIKPDHLDPWVKGQWKITLLSAVTKFRLSVILPLELRKLASSNREKPAYMIQIFVT